MNSSLTDRGAAGLAAERCFQHALREAAARCPECRRFFCRECITEHDGRVICAGCLRKLAAGAAATASRGYGLRLAVRGAASFLVLWLVFYGLGRLLLRLPSSFHEGTLWRLEPWERL